MKSEIQKSATVSYNSNKFHLTFQSARCETLSSRNCLSSMVNDTLNLFVDDNRKKEKQILLKIETRHCNSTKAKNFINRFFPHFVLFFSILRKLFRFEILAKSQHKEGLYHCERRTLCVWIFFPYSPCYVHEKWRRNRMLYQGARKSFFCFYLLTYFIYWEMSFCLFVVA